MILAVLSILIILASGVCLILSFFLGNLILAGVGAVFCLFLSFAWHELGHIVGCRIRKNRIATINLFPIKIEHGKLSFLPFPKFSVVFVTGKDDAWIYLLGPLFSFLEVTIVGVLLAFIPSLQLSILLFSAIIAFLGSFFPQGKSDLYKAMNHF